MGTALRTYNLIGWNDSIILYWEQEGLVTRDFTTGNLIHQVNYQGLNDILTSYMSGGSNAYLLVTNLQPFHSDSSFIILSLNSNDTSEWYTDLLIWKCNSTLEFKLIKTISFKTNSSFSRDLEFLDIGPGTTIYENGVWRRPIYTYSILGDPLDTSSYPVTNALNYSQATNLVNASFIKRLEDSFILIIHRNPKSYPVENHLLRLQLINITNDSTLQSKDLNFQAGGQTISHSLKSVALDTAFANSYLTVTVGSNYYILKVPYSSPGTIEVSGY